MTRPEAPPPRAYLVFVRRYGWIVVEENRSFGMPDHPHGGVQAYSRPGGVYIRPRDVIARAEMPPLPENAA